ncbi:MAG: hypothetical protein KKA64_02310 [Nanoarchaeota archaeon]|nr:hypothetical protein [Nanoarchaeota archaeon]
MNKKRKRQLVLTILIIVIILFLGYIVYCSGVLNKLTGNVVASKTQKYNLTCSKTYFKAWHISKCQENRCGNDEYVKCESKKTGFLFRKRTYYREVCEQTYSTTCVENPICRRGYKEIKKEVCVEEQVQPANMLIFISPQYSEDTDILNSINKYVVAVKKNLDWNTKIIKLDSITNKMDWIDKKIESLYNSDKIIVAMMVGEDVKTPLGEEAHGNQESPFVSTWADTNEGINDYSCKSCSCCKDYTPEVAISLIYPNNNLAYSTKKNQIISTFNKFAQQKQDYGNDINLFMSEEFSTGSGNKGFSFSPFGKLYLSGNLNTKINPTESDIFNSLSKSWKIYVAEGHADPSRTITNDDYSAQFYSKYLTDLDTALYLSNGCFTSGWFVDSSLNNNNLLDPPITSDWYGNYILINSYIRTEFNGGEGPDFTYCVAKMIAQGKTMAEIFISCNKNTGGVVMFGDPSLRFELFSQSPSPALEVWYDDITTTGSVNINENTTLNIKVRNTGNLNTTADIYVYDATNQFDLIGSGNTIYYSRLDGRTDLEICKKDNSAIKNNNFASFSCTWKPTNSVNHIVIRVFNKGQVELNWLDNGNDIVIVAS